MPRSRNRNRKAIRPAQLDPKRRDQLLAMNALKQLPNSLRSDVLTRRAPGEIGSISATSVITIGGHTVARTALFDAFRAAMRSNERQRMSMKSATAYVTVEADGRGSVNVRNTSYLIKNADLAAVDDARRSAAIERVISETSLTANDVARLRTFSVTSMSEDEFFLAQETYARSPAHIAQEFKDARRSGSIPLDGFFSPQPSYLVQLLPEPATSTDLEQFAKHELAAEFSERFKLAPEQAFQAWTRLFGSRAIVATTLILNVPRSDLKVHLKSLMKASNPYAIVGGVELCAALSADLEFVEIGRDLLSAFVAKIGHVRASMDLFAAVFCIAVPRMRIHSDIQSKPPFWRRAVATAHASLILDAAGPDIPEQTGLLEWAMSNTGSQFFLTNALEKSEQPRWQAEWVDPRVLFADLLGRLYSIDGTRLSGWDEPLAAIRTRMDKENLRVTGSYPSILEASLPLERRPLSELADFREFVEKVMNSPTPESLLQLRTLTYGYVLLDEVPDLARECMRQLIRDGRRVSETAVFPAIKFAADVAVLATDQELSKLAADALLAAARDLEDQSRLMEIISTFVICSGPSSAVERSDVLIERLMRLVRLQENADVMAGIRLEVLVLAELDPKLRPKLSRVISLAALGEG